MTERALVLIVEDNEANQLLASAVLELEGFEVRIAGSGPEALDVLRDCVPDLILMDVQLPGQDGLTLTRLIKDRKSTRLNSSHGYISYAVFCLKKKKNTQYQRHDQ